MSERAKLVYKDTRYMDEDLIKISKKECAFLGMEFESYQIDRNCSAINVFGKKNGNVEKIVIPFGALPLYKIAKETPVLEIYGRKLSNNDLLKIGNNVASLWGGYCDKYIIDRKYKCISFYCYENGEYFVTSVTFSELKKYM